MIELDGESLNFEKSYKILYLMENVFVSPKKWSSIKQSRMIVEQIVREDKTVYGINTGFGKLSDVRIGREDVATLQQNLIRSHASGVGPPLPEIVSRAMILYRTNALIKGFSGVRPETIELLVALLNERIHPVIPSQGSLGASGDLAPLAHLALVLLGEGEVFYKGRKMKANTALRIAGLQPLVLQAKEGLALINGTQAMLALGVVACLQAERLADQAEAIAAMTFQALRGIIDAFDERLHKTRGFREQTGVARRLNRYLHGSQLTIRQGGRRVQDAYSLRCIPQVHGAVRQTLIETKKKLEIEMNAATDNPLIFADGSVLCGGNFHGEPLAVALDFLAIAFSEMANISERRIERLVNPQLNDLPPFLSPQPGLQSGAMILQYTAASLVSENKKLAHPASVDSIPSSANQEDHVSMGTTAARYASMIVENGQKVLAIELICALEAAERRGPEKLSEPSRKLFQSGREKVASLTNDRSFSPDIATVVHWMKTGDWSDILIAEETN